MVNLVSEGAKLRERAQICNRVKLRKRANMRKSRELHSEHRQLELSRSSQLGVSEAVSRPSVSREVTAANIT